jgi:hypothetical protein
MQSYSSEAPGVYKMGSAAQGSGTLGSLPRTGAKEPEIALPPPTLPPSVKCNDRKLMDSVRMPISLR